MDQAILSTISALSGTVVGSLASFATTWLSQRAQTRAARLAVERERRQDLYARYMDEMSRVYGLALGSNDFDPNQLAPLFALRGRVVLVASHGVARSAERASLFLVDLSVGKAVSPDDARKLLDDASCDVIGTFARECRSELASLTA